MRGTPRRKSLSRVEPASISRSNTIVHRVHNTSEETAISVHVYGTDVTRIGSSARRYYD